MNLTEVAVLFKKRKVQMQDHRRSSRGHNIEALMKMADDDLRLVPLDVGKKRGTNWGGDWRSSEEWTLYMQSQTKNRKSKWKSNMSDAVAFSKIMAATSVLFDRNPEATLRSRKGFDGVMMVAKEKITASQQKEKFKDKMRLFVFNMAKYGTGFGRTYVYESERTITETIGVNPLTGEKKTAPKTITTREVEFEPLNNFNVWIDDMAKPAQEHTLNDWMFRKLYTDDQLVSEFGKSKETEKSLKASPTSSEFLNNESSVKEQSEQSHVNEVFFYENYQECLMYMESNGIPIKVTPLPDHARLSLSYALWNLRSDQSMDGVGLPEILRQNKALLEKVSNMTIDQIVLSIYKMYFHPGTNGSKDADIDIQPGKGQSVIDPSKINFLNIPGPGEDAYRLQEILRSNMDDDTGVGKALSGGGFSDPNMKAIAIAQAKDASLARLKLPLDGILSALANEAQLRWDLIQEIGIYPTEIKTLLTQEEIDKYLVEVGEDPERFKMDETGTFHALSYPELQAKIEMDESGAWKKGDTENTVMITPSLIRWQGDIVFSAEAVLVQSKELTKQMDLDMANLLIPLFQGNPELNKKPVEQILKIYGKDPKEWLPESWLNPALAPAQQFPTPPGTQNQTMKNTEGEAPPQSVVPESELGQGTSNLIQKIEAATSVDEPAVSPV